MARRNPNILVEKFSVDIEWAEDGEDCYLKVDLTGSVESCNELVARLTEELSQMFGNE